MGHDTQNRQGTVNDTLDRLPAAITQASEEIDALPDGLLELVGKRVERLRTSATS